MFRISALALCLAASPAVAQPASDAIGRPFDPGNPAVKGPPVEYRSVFGAELPRQSDIPWAAANEEMSKLRGHAGHIRETGPSSAPAEKSQPADRAPPSHHQH